MNKQKLFWTVGISLTLAAALISLYWSRPHEPVIVTIQATEPSLAEVTDTGESSEPERKSADKKAEPQEKSNAEESSDSAEDLSEEPAESRPLNRNLNTATAEELMRVNGIGDALAAAILEYREQCGGFQRRAQLTEVPGIGAVLAERIMQEFEIPDELPPENPETEPQTESDAPAEETEPVQPDENEVPPVDPSEAEPVGPFDVNTVTREELMQIPDMTEETADAILKLRGDLGCFRGIYELMIVNGLSGEYLEHVLRQYLYVVGDPYSIQP